MSQNPVAGVALRWFTRVALAVNVVALVAALLLAVVPLVLPFRVYSVLSGSMTPTIPIGAVVVDQAVPVTALRPGDVITFEPPGHPGLLVTHRIVRATPSAGGRVITTKGDANPAPDAWQLQAHGTGYRYVFGIPALGYFVVWSQSLFGRVTLVIIPALLLLALYLLEDWWDGRALEGAS